MHLTTFLEYPLQVRTVKFLEQYWIWTHYLNLDSLPELVSKSVTMVSSACINRKLWLTMAFWLVFQQPRTKEWSKYIQPKCECVNLHFAHELFPHYLSLCVNYFLNISVFLLSRFFLEIKMFFAAQCFHYLNAKFCAFSGTR